MQRTCVDGSATSAHFEVFPNAAGTAEVTFTANNSEVSGVP